MHGDPGQSSNSTGAWTGPTCCSWRVSRESRDWLWLTVGARTMWQKPQGLSLSVSSLGDCHFGTKTWPHSTRYGSSAGLPQVKQQQGGHTAMSISRQAASKHTLWHGPAHQRAKNHQWEGTSLSHPEECHKPLDQDPQEGRHRKIFHFHRNRLKENKCSNIHIIGVPEGEEREIGLEKILKRWQLKTPLTWKRKQSYKFRKCREYHRGPTRGGNTPRHIIIKWTKIKEKTLKATREKQQITYERIAVRLSADFSTDSLRTRKEWHNIFKVVKRKNLHEYSTQQGSHSYLTEKSKVYKQRIQHHQKALQQILKELH